MSICAGFTLAYVLPENIQHPPHYFTLQYCLPPICFTNKAISFDGTRCLSSFMKTHSDLHRPPSAAPLIKDTDITTKFRTSICHHCAESVCIMFVPRFVYVQVYVTVFATSLCVCTVCVYECLCLLLHPHIDTHWHRVFCEVQIASYCCSCPSHGTHHQGRATTVHFN